MRGGRTHPNGEGATLLAAPQPLPPCGAAAAGRQRFTACWPRRSVPRSTLPASPSRAALLADPSAAPASIRLPPCHVSSCTSAPAGAAEHHFAGLDLLSWQPFKCEFYACRADTSGTLRVEPPADGLIPWRRRWLLLDGLARVSALRVPQKEKVKKAELSTTARARQKAKEKKAEKAKAEAEAAPGAPPPSPPLPTPPPRASSRMVASSHLQRRRRQR